MLAEHKTESNNKESPTDKGWFSAPAITLPKGGGAIRGIGRDALTDACLLRLNSTCAGRQHMPGCGGPVQYAQLISYPPADGFSMDPHETTTSFVIKIWLEETAEEANGAVWRGHVTHVPSGERHYLKGLEDISAFIVPYLEMTGVKFD